MLRKESINARPEPVDFLESPCGQCYHPYEPETGETQRPERVSELLESKFETICDAVSGMSERVVRHIDKAHRVAKDMVATVAFFFAMIEQYMMNTDLNENEIAIIKDFPIPGFFKKMLFTMTGSLRNPKFRSIPC